MDADDFKQLQLLADASLAGDVERVAALLAGDACMAAARSMVAAAHHPLYRSQVAAVAGRAVEPVNSSRREGEDLN